MILTLGSSRRAESQSVVTSGSSVDVVMVISCSFGNARSIALEASDVTAPAIGWKEVIRSSLRASCAPRMIMAVSLTLAFFGSNFSTGPPASRQAAKPPPICATGFSPMSCAVFAASAERMPPAQ